MYFNSLKSTSPCDSKIKRRSVYLNKYLSRPSREIRVTNLETHRDKDCHVIIVIISEIAYRSKNVRDANYGPP